MRIRTVPLICVALVLGGLLLAVTAWGSERNAKDLTPADKSSLVPQNSMNVGLEVVVDGKPVKLITYEGRLYLPVTRVGAEYELRITNHGVRRITAVVSVDGLSVITKEPASESQAGYIVDPYSSTVVKGWRRDLDTVAAFTFQPREGSFAHRLGQRDNLGVIGLVAIEEYDPAPRPVEKQDMPIAAKDNRVLGAAGTDWGRDIGSEIIQVPFVRGDNKRTITIYYDTPESLRLLGIAVDPVFPNPFPKDMRISPIPDMTRKP